MTHSLLTQEIRNRLPPLYATESCDDPIVQAKFFTPDGGFTWYAIAFDGDDLFYGFVKGIDDELGYFSLTELQKVRGRMGLPVERDHHFAPTPLSRVR